MPEEKSKLEDAAEIAGVGCVYGGCLVFGAITFLMTFAVLKILWTTAFG